MPARCLLFHVVLQCALTCVLTTTEKENSTFPPCQRRSHIMGSVDSSRPRGKYKYKYKYKIYL